MLTCWIGKNRFDNFYGEDCARLDRGQHVREPFVECKPCYFEIASMIIFHANKSITDDFNAMYGDDMLYLMHWSSFMRKMNESWRDSRLIVSKISILSPYLISESVSSLPLSLSLSSCKHFIHLSSPAI